VVFLAWGAPAQKRCAKISGGKHVVLKAVHPSPLSAARGWFGCGHFKKTNEWLETRYGKEAIINWDLNVQKPIKAPGVKDEPVKVAESQKENKVDEDGPVTELPKVRNGKPASKKDEFDDEDDEDAIEALEELAKSDAVEPPEREVAKEAVEAVHGKAQEQDEGHEEEKGEEEEKGNEEDKENHDV